MGAHRVLDLQEARISDESIAALHGLTDLRELFVHGGADKPLTDASVEHLVGMTKLTRLFLVNTRLTDAGVERLAALPALRELSVESPAISTGLKARVQAKRKFAWLNLVQLSDGW